MDIWFVKENKNSNYIKALTPSFYSGDSEDLDSKSYRSKTTGNLNDRVISTRWSKLSFKYRCLTSEEFFQVAEIIKKNPIYAKCLHPIFSNKYIEAEFRVSKFQWEILETGDYSLSFNLIQKKKVVGQ